MPTINPHFENALLASTSTTSRTRYLNKYNLTGDVNGSAISPVVLSPLPAITEAGSRRASKTEDRKGSVYSRDDKESGKPSRGGERSKSVASSEPRFLELSGDPIPRDKTRVPRSSVSRQSSFFPRHHEEVLLITQKQKDKPNNYWLRPPPSHAFPMLRCKDIVELHIDTFVRHNPLYKPRDCVKDMKTVCNSIDNILKRHPAMGRFRLVCHATVAQLRNQGLQITDRATGHKDIDNRLTVTRQSKDYVIVVSVFATYKE